MISLEAHSLKKAARFAELELRAAAKALAPKHAGGEWEANRVAFDKLMQAERSFAAAEGRPYAVLEDFPLEWDTGAPLPTLLQTDHDTLLFFLLSEDDSAVGVVEFKSCLATSFGSPNDETIKGHPLYGRGFEAYRAHARGYVRPIRASVIRSQELRSRYSFRIPVSRFYI